MRVWTIELEIRELAMLVALGDPGGSDQGFGAGPEPAVTANHAVLRGRFPSTPTTQGTNFSGDLHDSLYECALCSVFLQVLREEVLCQSCGGWGAIVEK